MFTLLTLRPIVLLLSLFITQNVVAAINTQIDASRVSGVAPLTVFFDATATTSTATEKPFHELRYAWEFGDPDAGIWQYGNLDNNNKNQATGPVAAHVFETPGTYTVKLTTQELDGEPGNGSLTINVQNPNSIFPGKKTVCFSSTGNFTGCPEGAREVTTDKFQKAMAHVRAGKRLLFRRGETWNANGGGVINNDGPGLIGAFGSGNRPIIHNTSSEDLIQLSKGRGGHTNDWRIMDLDLTSANPEAEMVRADNSASNLLLLRLKGRNFSRFVSIPASVLHYYQSSSHKNLFVVENDFEDSTSHGGYVAAEGLVYMGNRLKDAPNSHVLRISYANPVIISNNSFLGGSGNSHHLLKFHSFNPSNDKYQRDHSSSGQFVISDNIIEHGTQGKWAFALGPQSSSGNRPENVRMGIIERNYFMAGADTRVFLALWTSEVTVRNNLFDQTGSKHAIGVSRRNQEAPPHDNSIYNNTFYSADSGDSLSPIFIDSMASDTTAMNNLFYTRDGKGLMVSGSAEQSGNLIMPGLSQNDLNRFKPIDKAIDGVTNAMVLDDYENNTRPFSAQYIGAYGRSIGQEPPPTSISQ